MTLIQFEYIYIYLLFSCFFLFEEKPNTIIIIIAVIGVLILLALLIGVFCFLKFRNSIGSSQKSLTMDSNIKEESIPSDINTNDDDLNLNNPPSPVKRDLHMDPKKQEENHRGGYSKQQFDEFE
ncbi:unnamed protein product [Rotaria sordida]|uniref:Uncharacterized protein n=1 Tax=Rotaria sordida TaxID=392033 RepID=A0A815SSR0_9BILA|nr:unnamed protein product [Rotaria sordida]